MELVIGHIATTGAWDRFIEAQKWQSVLGVDTPGIRHVVITDREVEVPNQWPAVVDPSCEVNELYNLSRLRNHVRRYAQEADADGFMIMESDFIAFKWPTMLPTYWAIPFAIYDRGSELTFRDIKDAEFEMVKAPRPWEILGPRQFIPVHCVVVAKAAFDRAVWDEEFVGNGFDDWDFNNMMSQTFGPMEHTDARILHRWHDVGGRKIRKENQERFEQKWGKVNPTFVNGAKTLEG